MLHMKRRALILALWVIISAGCDVQSVSGPSSTLTIAPPLNPYQSTEQTQVPETPTQPVSTLQPLIPSATPFKHIVRSGETLYGIAIQYNIPLERLVSANPGLDSRMLIVGTEVIIPLEEGGIQLLIPTPYPLLVEKPTCFPTTEQGLWCYSMVENNQNMPLENISVAINIYDTGQDLIKTQIAYSLLDILYPGQILPVGDFIPDPPASQDQISATLLTAFPSDQVEPDVLISDYTLDYSQEGTIVQVKGFFEILNREIDNDTVWIVGVGSSQGDPVAVRKWISTEGLESGVLLPFDFILYSLGPPIDQVLIFGEAH